MSGTGKNPVPVGFVLDGKVVGMPDVWGNSFPVSETKVELFTSHQHYISGKFPGNNPPPKLLLASGTTLHNGTFSVGFFPHPTPEILPHNTLFLEFTNNATGAKYNHQVSLNPAMIPTEVQSRSPYTGYLKVYELNAIQTPWNTEAPVISSWNGRQFRYPADFAGNLTTDLGLKGGFDLKRFANPSFVLDHTAVDDLFVVLERESRGSKNGITRKFANAIVPVLGINLMKVRSSRDVFRMTLEHCSRTRINTPQTPDFNGRQLGAAVQKAFGGPHPSFSELESRAAFCGLVFAAAALDAGSKVSASFRTVDAVFNPVGLGFEGHRVTSVVIS